MEYTFKRAEYTDSAVLFDGCQEQPLDLDVSLPDYCPDIQRILKCQVLPCISGHSLNGDRLETEGVVRVRVLYLDSREDTVRCCEMESGFSSVIPLRETPEAGAAQVTTRLEYVNCRAASPRRLDIHGAFSICAQVLESRRQPVCTHSEEEGLEQRCETLSASALAGLGEQQFTLTETLEINSSKPPAEAILRSRCYCVVQDFRPVSGKFLAKGTVRLEVLYTSSLDGSSLERMDFEIPFSQMIDCLGASEECRCSLRMEVTNHSIQIRSDANGEPMRLETEVRMSAFARACRDQELTFVTDAYSTQYETELDYTQIQVSGLDDVVQETAIEKVAMEPSGELGRVIDVWNEVSNVSGEIQNGQITFSGKMNLCLLAADSQGVPFYQEKLADFSLSRAWNGPEEDRRVSCWAQVGPVGYRITGGTGLELSAEIFLGGTVTHTASCRAISGMHGDESRCKEENRAVLSLYYACERESLWEIARSHGVSVRSLCEENGLAGPEESLTEGQMLLLAAP